jgi:hypothetical protein
MPAETDSQNKTLSVSSWFFIKSQLPDLSLLTGRYGSLLHLLQHLSVLKLVFYSRCSVRYQPTVCTCRFR